VLQALVEKLRTIQDECKFKVDAKYEARIQRKDAKIAMLLERIEIKVRIDKVTTVVSCQDTVSLWQTRMSYCFVEAA
jgi:polyribonucleotide nucleotidyltransferase